jgi:methylated-DNA-[protein]-cysteine S-methyltransferase
MESNYSCIQFKGPDSKQLWAVFKNTKITQISSEKPPIAQGEMQKYHLQFLLEMDEYLRGNRDIFTTLVDFENCSEFQTKVLEFVSQIPYGEVVTYKDIAIYLELNAYQAVGTALKNNPIPFLIPCHRVINSSGAIGEFNLGQRTKIELLKIEDAHVQFEIF